VLYHGLEVLGGGAILVSLVLAAIAASMIDRQFVKAAAFSVAGAVLTFFGFMHSEAIGIGKTPLVALAYLGVAVILFAVARYEEKAALPVATGPHEPESPAHAISPT
jgi:AGZA family xanthine/uracil permease-like MFS transporter